MAAVAGLTTNVFDVAAFTVNTAVADWRPKVAVMVDVPTALPVARPFVTPDMLATPAPVRSGEVHTEAAVLSMVDPSLNVSIAVNCCVPLTGVEAVAGVTFKPFDVVAFTVNTAVADCRPKVAVMVDVPTAFPVARPLVTADMLATPTPVRSGDVHVEAAVLSMVDPSLNV